MPYRLYTASDIDRPPSWRYERVRHILSQPPEKQVFVDSDDASIRHFYQFCQQWSRARSPEEQHIVRLKYPGISEAVQLRKYGTLDGLGLLEGYFIAECELSWLSQKFCLPPAAVVWYEQLFFDVYSRKTAGSWIELNVIRPVFYAGRIDFKPATPAYDRACAYRAFGHRGGNYVLEIFSTGFLDTDAKPKNGEAAEAFIRRALEIDVVNQSALLNSSRKYRTKTEADYIRIAIDIASRSFQQGNADVLINVQRALKSIAPLVGEDVKMELEKLAAQNPHASAMLGGALELRHMEQSRLMLGLEMSPETQHLITNFYERNSGNVGVNEGTVEGSGS